MGRILTKQDYYEILGISKEASEEDVRKSFRKKALEFHPDRNKDPGAEQKFKEVNEAYQILMDSEKRARYDRYGHAGLGPEAGFARDFEGFDIFGGLGGCLRFLLWRLQFAGKERPPPGRGPSGPGGAHF